MEFTKEQIEYLKKGWENYDYSIVSFFDSLLKPETKFVNVRIEFNEISGVIEEMPVSMILQALVNGFDPLRNIKVTELPEVFSRDDLIDFYRWKNKKGQVIGDMISAWLLERKSK